MSSILNELGDTALNTVGETAAFAGGTSGARALNPLATTIAQLAWALAPILALDAGTAAAIAAENVDAFDRMAEEAKQHGLNAERFKDLYGVTLNAPGFGEVIAAVRRGKLGPDDLTHLFRKSKWEPRWDEAIADLQHERIPIGDLALAVVRGIVPDAGLLPVTPPAHGDKVPRFPVANLDVIAEAAAWGWDKERFRARVGAAGLSLAPVEAAHATYRGIIGPADYELAIAEGDIRNEWRDTILEVNRQIPTPSQFEEAALRGVLTNAQADAGAALHGMTPEHARLLFEIMGRSLAVHQITTGLARGATLGGTYNDVPEPFRDAIRRSNIRPEYAKLAYANRFNYPSAFVLRSLTQTGEITEADAHDTLLKIGWEPSFAEKVSKAWGGGTASKGDSHVAKAETHVWTALHKSYVDQKTTDSEAAQDLATLGVAAPAIPEVVRLWQLERSIVRRDLTPVEIRKAIGQTGKDAAWAKQRLLELGYDSDDADTFLAE